MTSKSNACMACLLVSGLAVIPIPAWGIADCTVSASAVAFGNYVYSAASPLDASGNVRVSCSLIGLVSLLVSYDIALSTGSGSYAARQMSSGANQLQYNLYTNSARTIVWGDGNGGTSTISDSYLLGLLTVERDYPIYGRVPIGQNVPAGGYNDIITVTVTY